MTSGELKKTMGKIFQNACAALQIHGHDVSLGVRSSASFYCAADANALRDALVAAGAAEVSVHHWDPKECGDFDRDEWQVSWG